MYLHPQKAFFHISIFHENLRKFSKDNMKTLLPWVMGKFDSPATTVYLQLESSPSPSEGYYLVMSVFSKWRNFAGINTNCRYWESQLGLWYWHRLLFLQSTLLLVLPINHWSPSKHLGAIASSGNMKFIKTESWSPGAHHVMGQKMDIHTENCRCLWCAGIETTAESWNIE